jgi:hypothetical protein
MWVTGEGTDQVNSILRHISKEVREAAKLAEFTVETV